MDEKRPKRRKDKYNPYTLTEKEEKNYLNFWIALNWTIFHFLMKWIGITSIQNLPRLLYMTGRLFSRNRLRMRFFAICGMRHCTTL